MINLTIYIINRTRFWLSEKKTKKKKQMTWDNLQKKIIKLTFGEKFNKKENTNGKNNKECIYSKKKKKTTDRIN